LGISGFGVRVSPRLRPVRKFLVVVIAVSASIAAFYLFGGRYSESAQGAFVHTFGDVMEWRSRSIAGWGAVNCGIVPIRGNADAATDCALRAFASHRPFRVRYGLQTYDTVMATGVVASPDGRVYELIFSGGPPTGITDVFRQRVAVNTCPVPASLRSTPKGRISCFDPASPTPANWSSSWLSEAP
jgi:hypothetical protein